MKEWLKQTGKHCNTAALQQHKIHFQAKKMCCGSKEI